MPDMTITASGEGKTVGGEGRETDLFYYTDEQRYNIHMGLHPDCCVAEVCTYCGASEANLKGCAGELSGLALELFEEASCSAYNANIKSIGQATNWQVHNRHARVFDAAARAIARPTPDHQEAKESAG